MDCKENRIDKNWRNRTLPGCYSVEIDQKEKKKEEKDGERKRLQTSINVMAILRSQKKRKVILCYYERDGTKTETEEQNFNTKERLPAQTHHFHTRYYEQHHIKHHTFISSVLRLGGTVLEGFIGKRMLRIHG